MKNMLRAMDNFHGDGDELYLPTNFDKVFLLIESTVLIW